MKKILIIYPFINQEPLVYNLVINLRKNGINADAINSTFLKHAAKPIYQPSLQFKIIFFLFSLPIPKVRGFFSKVIGLDNILVKLANNYDLIDFHFFSKSYDRTILKLLKLKIIKITIWGSDFYRADSLRREQQRVIFEKCNSIQIATNNMKNDFIDYFHDFEEKIKTANFGIVHFDIISKIKKTTYSPLYKTQLYDDKLMVVCGYNGSQGQQHSIIIEALNKLDKSVKDKIFLVFPMTYGATKAYVKEVMSKLNNIQIPFIILESHLSDIDVAKLRIETDLVINIQITDAFSGSLQEHIYAENLVLVGDWLPYSILDENDVFYKKTNLDDLANQISDCIVNNSSYKKMTLGNMERMHNISSWSVAGKKLSMIYKELLI